jgi:hypothetical protein
MNSRDCLYIVKARSRYFTDFDCSHPENRVEDVRNPSITREQLDEAGCESWEGVQGAEAQRDVVRLQFAASDVSDEEAGGGEAPDSDY